MQPTQIEPESNLAPTLTPAVPETPPVVTPGVTPAVTETPGVTELERIRVFDLPIDNLTMAEAVEQVIGRLERATPSRICFVNADCVNLSFVDRAYRETLQTADLAFADGSGMKLAGWVLHAPIRDNVNGTDMLPILCHALGQKRKTVFLLGARPGVADGVRDWIARHYPNVVVTGCQDGYFPPDKEPEIIQQIAESRSDLLLVAFGSPRQDQWIRTHLNEFNIRVAAGVGGLFDFYSNRIPRAPRWIRHLGMEWAYRFFQEPRRLWRRYLMGNPLFLARLARERLRRPAE